MFWIDFGGWDRSSSLLSFDEADDTDKFVYFKTPRY